MTSLVAIGDLASDLRTGFACGEQDESGVVQFRMNNVARDGSIDWAKLRRVPSLAVRRDLTLEPGDILFNATNSPELVGKTALFAGFDEDVTFSNHFVRLRPKPGKADSAYIARWLQSQFEKGTFSGMCRQWVNQATVTKDQLSTLQIPLPPLDEQRRIATILDKADVLRRKRKRALELLDRLMQSIFLDMFGDPVSNQKAIAVTTLGELGVNMTYGPRFHNEKYDDDGIRIVRITDLDHRGNLNFNAMPRLALSREEIQIHQSRAGEILFARTGATVGKMALILPEDPVTVPGAYFIRLRFPKEIDPFFAWHALRSVSVQKIVEEQSRQSAQQNFSGPSLRRLPFLMPNKKEQKRFGVLIRELMARSKANNAYSSQIDRLFNSLRHRAFTDKI